MAVLQQLPLPPAEFVDRDPVLSWLSDRFEEAVWMDRSPQLVLYGPHGVGLHSVVYEWYHRHRAEWFPDGAVRVVLGTTTPDGVVSPYEALGDVLVDLGVSREELPESIDARVNRFRSLTHSRRLLVVLEGASGSAQVQAFLLNSPGSALVVLSRSRLRKLEMDGFKAMSVAPLAEGFGLELFERMLGPGWFSEAQVEPSSVARVCGGYPLAIRATAAQIASTPEWEVVELIRDLARRGLGALDPETQEYVRDSFDRAYQRLEPMLARAYRLVVGLYPGAVVFVDAAAVLLGVSENDARTLLTSLVGAELLTRTGVDKFEFHEVAHWHARDRAEADEPFAQLAAAVERVSRWYLAQTIERDRVLSDRPRLGPGYVAIPELAGIGREAALDWLEERRGNFLALVPLAERFRFLDEVWQLCEALWGVYHLHGHFDEWITTHRSGLEVARQLSDRRIHLRMASQLGSGLIGKGDLGQAEKTLDEAYRVAVEVGDVVAAQSAMEWLGKIATRRKQYELAHDYYNRSWALVASCPERLRPRMYALLWLQRARTDVLAEVYDTAWQAGANALDFFDGTSERDNTAKSLLAVAGALKGIGDVSAVNVARRAAVLFRSDGSVSGEIAALEVIEAISPTDGDLVRLRELRERRDGHTG